MASTFTTNKSIEKPASGDYNNAWASPVNADWDDIDAAFGGHTQIDVTGLSGAQALMLSQYRPPNIEFIGTLSAAVTFVLPTGVGGLWTLQNATGGAFALSFGVSGGTSVGLLAGNTSLVVSDGTNCILADTSAATQAQTNAENFATAAIAAALAGINISSGTFVGTLTGMTGSVVGTIHYNIAGKICVLTATASILGTASSSGFGGNSMTMTGLPVACRPASLPVGVCVLQDNGTLPLGPFRVSGSVISFGLSGVTSGVVQAFQATMANFTAGAVKGLPTGWTITYTLD